MNMDLAWNNLTGKTMNAHNECALCTFGYYNLRALRRVYLHVLELCPGAPPHAQTEWPLQGYTLVVDVTRVAALTWGNTVRAGGRWDVGQLNTRGQARPRGADG